MFNDDQLAAIAAAMSILQNSMQSNSPTTAPVPQEQQQQQQQPQQQQLSQLTQQQQDQLQQLSQQHQHHQQQQQQQQLQHQQLQHLLSSSASIPAAVANQTPQPTTKGKPQSYSSIVAKSVGPTNSSLFGSLASNGILNGIHINPNSVCNSNNSSSSNNSTSSTNLNNTFGGLTNNSTFSADSTYSITSSNLTSSNNIAPSPIASSINAIGGSNSLNNINPNATSNSNTTNSTNHNNSSINHPDIQGTLSNNHHAFTRGVPTSNSIVRNTLTSHLANSTIFNTSDLTGNSSLGLSNGSLLNHQQQLQNDQGNLSMAIEPTINFTTTNHSTTANPAQQLFHPMQELNQHHQQMMTQFQIHPKQQPHHQHQQNLQNNQSSLSMGFEPTINFTTNHSLNNPAQQLFLPMQELNHQYQQQQQQQQQQVITQLQNIHPKQQHQLHNQPQPTNHQPQPPQYQLNHHQIITPLSNSMSSPGICTNLLGFMGLYVGNLSPDLTKEQLEKIFSKYGEPVKAHRLIRSPVAFIKYDNLESPRAAIQDLYGVILPELTLNQDQPLKLHFDRNDYQLKINYRPTELPPKFDNGECYGWRTTVCRKGKNCPKRHILINRGIDFQMWMIKSAPTTPVATGHAPSTIAAITSSNTAAAASIP